MGLFGKVFEKKVCSICGGEIGLLGNRKLEDGNCCKSCAGKLSPWFGERRHSTVEEIRQQLAYREFNEAEARVFHVSRTYGEGSTILMIDETSHRFCVAQQKDLPGENPDIVELAKITNMGLKTEEHQTEIYRTDKDGKQVSFEPKRYRYSYDFYYEIHVDHPYFDTMRFRLNSSTIEVREAPRFRTAALRGVISEASSSMRNSEYDRFQKLGEEITQYLEKQRSTQAANMAAFLASGGMSDSYESIVLKPTPQTTPETPSESWTCEFCGTVNTGNFCTGCGCPRT